MVGRFIQQQQVRLGDTGPRNERKALPTTAQGAKRAVVELVRKTERGQDDIDPPCLVVAQRRRQSLEHRVAQWHFAQVFRQFLFGIANGQPPAQGKFALIRLVLTRQDPEQSRLAAAIGADQSKAVAVADGKTRMFENCRCTMGDAEIVGDEERHDTKPGTNGLPKGAPFYCFPCRSG